MSNPLKKNKDKNNKINEVEVISEFTKKNIEKSYNFKDIKGTEAYYSNRYGWTLRKSTE